MCSLDRRFGYAVRVCRTFVVGGKGLRSRVFGWSLRIVDWGMWRDGGEKVVVLDL
jgi:hypothetical protein